MRNLLALTLLVVYLLAAAQPLLPWFADGLEHVFNWHDHLENVHHGHVHSTHVGDQMASADDHHPSHASTSHVFSFQKDLLSAHLVPVTQVTCPVSEEERVELPLFFHSCQEGPTAEVLLPPPDRHSRLIHH